MAFEFAFICKLKPSSIFTLAYNLTSKIRDRRVTVDPLGILYICKDI